MEHQRIIRSASHAAYLIFFLVVLNVVILRTAFITEGSWYLALLVSMFLLYLAYTRLKYLLQSKSIVMQKTKENNSLVIRTDDYQLLSTYLKSGNKSAFDQQNAEDLETELKRAKVVTKNLFPPDVVRINSTVRIKELDRDKEMEFQLVTPDRANIREKKISVMAPMGTALLGFRQGQEVNWKVPSGRKTFTIVEVINLEEEN